MSSLAPGILIAAPPIGDPNFDRTVVLLASHDADGAFGWVINGEEVMPVAELLVQAGIAEKRGTASGVVTVGGPVSDEQVWLVYPRDEMPENMGGQFDVGSRVVATASRELLERLHQGFPLPHLRAFAGYAGWAPGQLEREIRGGGWLPGPLDYELLFQTPRKEIWQRAYQHLGTSPIAFTTRIVGSA
jgi:putative transcriptional regulator